MHRLTTLLLALLAIIPAGSLAAEAPAAAPVPARPITTAITRGHITLSLQLPALAFPHNALIPATVHLTNHTGHTINTWDCLRNSLAVEVFSLNGVRSVYPPLLQPPGAPWSDCPGGMGMGEMRHMVPIPAGQTLTRSTDIVLRAFRVRALVSLALTPTQRKPTLIQTPAIHIHQTAAPGPSLRLRMGLPITALVTPVTGAGPILYSEYASCGSTTRRYRIAATLSQWIRASSPVLHPFRSPCAPLTEWLLFVAQPGRPIARAYYCAPHVSCAYAPPTPQQRGIIACKQDVGKAVSSGRLPRSAARYAIGIDATLPAGLSRAQQTLARAFHARCAPLLKRQP